MAASDRIAQLYIALEEIEPAIWRRVEVPLSATLKSLHDIIQCSMGWEGYHLHEFEIGERRYGDPAQWDDDRFVLQERSLRLQALIARSVDHFTYTYDFGDNWRHIIQIEAVRDADPDLPYPRLVEATRRCPPEDVGGVDGYYEFCNAVTKPRHREHRRMLAWYGSPYDPEDADVSRIEAALARMAQRRLLGKAAFEKSRSRQR
jgi:hypothetical protein